MSARIDRGEVERIAALAHLELDAAATDRLTADMGAMLEYAARVLAVDTSGVAPTSHPLGLDPALRDDAASAATTSTILFAGGLALVAGGAALFLLAPKTASTTGMRVQPSVGKTGAGLSLSGGF